MLHLQENNFNYILRKKYSNKVIFTGNINRQPGFINIKKKVHHKGYPNADFVMRNGVLLPCHHGLSEEMFMKLHSVINQFIKNTFSFLC